MFLAEFSLFLSAGPTNSIVANSVPASIRARAFGFLILFIHFGDAVSPTLVGVISDLTGSYVQVHDTVGIQNGTSGNDTMKMEYIGDIRKGVVLVPLFFLLSFIIYLCGLIRLEETETFEFTVKVVSSSEDTDNSELEGHEE